METKNKKSVSLGTDKVKLRQTETAIEEVFDLDHAERILAYDVRIARTNWELVDKTLKFENGKITTGTSDSTNNNA